MDPSPVEIGLVALGALDAPEVRDAIATFLGASVGGRALTRSHHGASIVTVSSGREALVEASTRALPFADRSFIRVLCVDSLRHESDPEPFLTEARRVLAPGGGLLSLAVEPNARTTRGLLVKAGFSWSESYEVVTVERATEASDCVEVRVFATTGWVSVS
jgi:SAM-dependent methyltransferase